MAQNNNDDELYELFSAFDNVSASDELKTATLARIAATADYEDRTEPDIRIVESSTAGATGAPCLADETEATNSSASDQRIRTVASSNNKTTSNTAKATKWRTKLVAALAACLALALTGGIAYATPVSYVSVTQGEDTSISLGVNCFGVAVTATSDDAAGKAVIEATELRNMSRDESTNRAVEALESLQPGKPVEVDGQPQNTDRLQQPPSEGAEIVRDTRSEAGIEPSPESTDGSKANDKADGDSKRQADTNDSPANDDNPGSPDTRDMPSNPGKPDSAGDDRADRGNGDAALSLGAQNPDGARLNPGQTSPNPQGNDEGRNAAPPDRP